MTVFLALLLSLSVSLVCVGIQSARMAAGRTQILNSLDVGLYSLFAQYDREVFKEFDLFVLDAPGEEEPDLASLCETMEDYVRPVLSQNGRRLSLKQASLEGYLLMTDEGGEPFYRQAVQYMKETLGLSGAQLLLRRMQERQRKTVKAEDAGAQAESEEGLEAYEREMRDAGQKSLEAKEAKEGETGTAEGGSAFSDGETVQVENPIPAVRRVRWMGLLELVFPPDKQLSDKKASSGVLASARRLCRGMALSKSYKKDRSLAAQVLFQQYLLERLGNLQSPGEGVLAYQIEYVLGGKKGDEENLRLMAKKLLLVREGVNLAALTADAGRRAQTGALANAIASGFLIPPAAGVIETALLLCWAFGESVLDVRELLAGGRVPLVKEPKDWQLSLENLPDLISRLDVDRRDSKDGMSYQDYLQVFLFALDRETKIKRGLDMVEAAMRGREGWEDFRMDHCITALEASIQVQAYEKTLTAKREYCY